ncbi:hypothetical protein K488DRAFT_72095 [Vararia minispora EC-137]|uniref:Uncharacterized protein n=1 Tax=Vararia minispora EC-137 TaxID=1314806 RepID=A0ACB8QFG3_9AGAM|nr:hypothetical protein K488DRAFT_72095 [Vararia minispora EC-137]
MTSLHARDVHAVRASTENGSALYYDPPARGTGLLVCAAIAAGLAARWFLLVLVGAIGSILRAGAEDCGGEVKWNSTQEADTRSSNDTGTEMQRYIAAPRANTENDGETDTDDTSTEDDGTDTEADEPAAVVRGLQRKTTASFRAAFAALRVCDEDAQAEWDAWLASARYAGGAVSVVEGEGEDMGGRGWTASGEAGYGYDGLSEEFEGPEDGGSCSREEDARSSSTGEDDYAQDSQDRLQVASKSTTGIVDRLQPDATAVRTITMEDMYAQLQRGIEDAAVYWSVGWEVEMVWWWVLKRRVMARSGKNGSDSKKFKGLGVCHGAK